MDEMALAWDVDDTLCLDESVASINETFEELEQSILSILAEDHSEIPFSSIPKSSTPNNRSDFKNHLSFEYVEVSGYSENSPSEHRLSPVALFKESGLKRHHSDSFLNTSPPLSPEKLKNVRNVRLLTNSPIKRSRWDVRPTMDLKENRVSLQNGTLGNIQNSIIPSMRNLAEITAQVIFNKNPNSPSKALENKNILSRSPKLPLRSKNTEENYVTVKKIKYDNTLSQSHPFPHLNSITDRSAIACLIGENKNGPSKMIQSAQFPICKNSDGPQMIINPPSSKPLQLDQLEQKVISSQCGKWYPINKSQLELEEQFNRNPVSSDCTVGNSTEKRENMASKQPPLQLEQKVISSQCGKWYPINKSQLELEEQSNRNPVSSDCTVGNSTKKQENMASTQPLKPVDDSLKTNPPLTVQTIIHENPCNTVDFNEKITASGRPPSESLCAPVICIDSSDDDDVLTLFIDEDELESINVDSDIDEDTLLGIEDNVNDSDDYEKKDQVLNDIKQRDTNHVENQRSTEAPCKSNSPISVLENVGVDLSDGTQCELSPRVTSNFMAGDKADTQGGTCLQNALSVDLKVKAAVPTDPSYLVENDPSAVKIQPTKVEASHKLAVNPFVADDESQDSVVLVVEELKCDNIDTKADQETGFNDYKSAGVISDKCGDTLTPDLPLKENKIRIGSKLTTVSDKISRASLIPKSKADTQNLKQPQPKVQIIKEIPLPMSESSQAGNSNASGNDVQTKKISKPFKSADPEENKDLDHPEWENMKMLTTDAERYKEVRNRWKSKTVPNPNRDLTFHSFRKRKVQGQAAFTTSNDARQGQKRAADSILQRPAAKRVRTRTLPCTYLIDNKIESAKQQYSKDTQTVQQAYKEESESLFTMRTNAEWNLKARAGYNFQPYFCQDFVQLQMLEADHQNAENELIMKCHNDLKVAQSALDTKLNALQNARQEIEKFCKFYKGLNKSSDGDPMVVTENQIKELNEMEMVFHQFNAYYKY